MLIDKIGIDAFRDLVEEELKGDWVSERDYTLDPFDHDEEAGAPAKPATSGSPNGDHREFDRWARSNVVPQRQEGFSAVQIKVTRGDLSPEQFRGLADLMREYSGGYARTTVWQNLVLRWVRDESVYDVWQALKGLGLGDPGAEEVADVVSCPGTDSCKLGITASMGLNQAVQERIESIGFDDPLVEKLHIKMSGCPNGCSQHHIGNIGFYGASMKVGDRTIPAYIPHLGGEYDKGEVAFGERLKSRLPAKRVPDAIERILRHYQDAARRRRGVQRLRRPPADRALRGAAGRPLAAGRVQPRDDEPLHRLEPLGALPGDQGRGRVRGLAGTAERRSKRQSPSTIRAWRWPAPSRRRSRS